MDSVEIDVQQSVVLQSGLLRTTVTISQILRRACLIRESLTERTDQDSRCLGGAVQEAAFVAAAAAAAVVGAVVGSHCQKE